MAVSNFVGFRLRSDQPVNARALGKRSPEQKFIATSILQRSEELCVFQLVVRAEDDEGEAAVLKATGWLWNLLEEENVKADIEMATFNLADYTDLAKQAVASLVEIKDLDTLE